ncbi:alpha/beta hydrolase [Spirosoma sp. KNUC1025]|uniref:alpha/beta hydrolase n=1 Tax=Spirosoma sp. KNUC1025 TaxID=2894082 RepID=UPI0038644C9A|nr:alpha/beta hydrolase [Spirosoma sp. KNUC1025]
MTARSVHLFQFESYQIAYRKFGRGQSVLIAFHGFGQTGQVYLPIETYLASQFTVYAIDLFFHGNSYYPDNKPLSEASWWRLLDAFLLEQRIERFSLMGFSLGGRFALSMVEGFSDQLDQLILIAPDGIIVNGWYRLATGSGPGRFLFRYGLKHLSILYGLGHLLTRLGLLNRTVMRFAEISLHTAKQRERVYQSWTQFRCIKPNLDSISHSLNTKAISVHFFVGAFDRLVPGTYISPLTQKIRRFKLTVLKTGHNRLIELAAEKLINSAI